MELCWTSVERCYWINTKGFFILSKENTALSCPVPQVLVSPFLVSVLAQGWCYRVGTGGVQRQSTLCWAAFCKSDPRRNLSSFTLFLYLKFHSSCLLPQNSSFFHCKPVRQLAISRTYISAQTRAYVHNVCNLRVCKNQKSGLWITFSLYYFSPPPI